MSDRELLEMAAKSAGYDGLCWSMLLQCFYDCSGVYWRPLDDDGDALRLAVKITIDWGSFDVVAKNYGEDVVAIEKKGSDPYAATRRAIVRAAAKIGRGMK